MGISRDQPIPAFYREFPDEHESCWICDGLCGGTWQDMCQACRDTEQDERDAEGRRCQAWRERQGVTLTDIDAMAGDTRCHTSAEVAAMEAGTDEGDPDTWLPSIIDTVARVLAQRADPSMRRAA